MFKNTNMIRIPNTQIFMNRTENGHVPIPHSQVHPAFQGINSTRYVNHPPQAPQPPHQFNASTTSPIFFGYSSAPNSKL